MQDNSQDDDSATKDTSKQNNHTNKCIQLNDTLIDLKNRKTLELDDIGKLTENDVIFDDITYVIPTAAYALIMYITGFIFIYILRKSN